MNFKHLVEHFKSFDLKSNDIMCNYYSRSVWVKSDADPRSTSFHVKQLGHEEPVLLIYAIDENKIHYEFIYSPHEKNTLTINWSKELESSYEQLQIHNINTITSEEVFFQESLINDFSDFEYSDFVYIREVYNEAVGIAKEKLDDEHKS